MVTAVIAVVSALLSQTLTADDQAVKANAAPSSIMTSDARPRVASEATENRLAKFNSGGTTVDSAVSENNGNVFMAQNGRLYFWPDVSGSSVFGNGTGLTLYGMGGTINLSNADTVVNGYGATALTVNGSGTTGTTAGLNVKNSAGTSVLFVKNDGTVGIGTTSPATKLHVWSDILANATITAGPDAVNGPALSIAYGGGSIARGAAFLNVKDASAVAPNPSLRFQTASVERMIITNTGTVGIGTSSPGSNLTATQESPLHIYSSQDKGTFLQVQNSAVGLNAAAILRTSADSSDLSIASHSSARTISRYGQTMGGWNEILAWGNSNGLAIGTAVPKPVVFGTNSIARMTIDGSGNVTIGNPGDTNTTTINGTLMATKVIGAVYQDVAEWVPATTHMEPGTVVVLNRDRNNEVMPSVHAYDTAVAGVVSAQPGLILGVASDSKAQIATTGRVKVRVDAAAGPIAVGDLLVTSDKSGRAMKSQPVDLGGVQFHRPGTVVGKALEPLPAGEGEILVLLSLQ